MIMTGNKFRKKQLLYIVVAIMLSILIFVGGSLVVPAQEKTIADYQHQLAFSQKELAGMLEFTLAEELEFDFARLVELIDETADVPDSSELVQEWLAEHLEGLLPLGEIIEGDGYFGIIAMDLEVKEIHLLVFNSSEDSHRIEMTIFDKRKMPVMSEVYLPIAINEEVDKATNSNVNEDNLEDEDFEVSEDYLLFEYEIALQREFSNKAAKESYAIVLKEGEFGRIVFKTGLLNGGLIRAEEDDIGLLDNVMFSDSSNNHISDLTLQTAGTNTNILRIYSVADKGQLGIETEYDFATYSVSKHAVFYELDQDSIITVNRVSTTASRNFYIELYNSQPVTIKQYRFVNETNNISAKSYFTAKVADPVLNINNQDGAAILWHYDLYLSGTGTINAYSGTEQAMVELTNSNSDFEVKEGFSLDISGAGGIASKASLQITKKGKVNIHDINNETESGTVLAANAVGVNDSELTLENITVTTGNVVDVVDTITLKDAYLTINQVSTTDGSLVFGKTLSSNNSEMTITQSIASKSGLQISGAAAIKDMIFLMEENFMDEYVLEFTSGAGNNIETSKFDINTGDSKGGGLYFGGRTATVFYTSELNLVGSKNEKPLLEATNRVDLGRTGTTSANQRTGSSIKISLGEDSQAEGIFVNELVMYQTSSIEIDGQSLFARNMYVAGNVDMNGSAWMNHTSSLVGKPGDINGIAGGDEGGDDEETEMPTNPDDPEEEEEEEGDDSNEDIIVANTELNSYLLDTQAVVYIKGQLSLNTADNYLEIYGNADKQNESSKVTPYGLILGGSTSTITDGGYIKIENVQIGLLAQTLNLDYRRGDKSFDTAQTIIGNKGKSRVYVKATHIGAICTNYFGVLRSANFYAEGGSAGIMARRTSASRIGFGVRQGSTVIAIGKNAGSSGFIVTQDIRFYGGMKVIAEGDANGVLLTERSSRVFARYGAQLIAVGRSETSSGIYSKNNNGSRGTIRSSGGAYIYAFGGMNGIYAENTNIIGLGSSSRRSTIVGIGGVPAESLSHTLADMDYLNTTFELNNLPEPILAEGNRGVEVTSEDEIEVPGIVQNGVAGSRGIVTGGNREPQIRANSYTTIKGIGGEWGIANTSQALDDDESETGGQIWANGGTIIGHGGAIGILSQTRVYVNGNVNGGLWGYGEDYGIYAYTTLRTRSNYSYIYGIGKTSGLFSEKGYEATTNSQIVGETWIAPTANENEPLGKSAVDVRNAANSINIARSSILHEVYNAMGVDFTSRNPYQLNLEYKGIGLNIGEDPETLGEYTWTTPKADLEISTDWVTRAYLDYQPNDNQRFIHPGWGVNEDGNQQYGLISTTSQSSMTVIANRAALDSRVTTSEGAIYGRGVHRMSFRRVSTVDTKTMKVQFDLREIIGTNHYNVQNLPDGLSFELDFTPQSTIGYQEDELPLRITIDDADEYHYDKENGVLTFYKLRTGEYTLRAVNHYGWPYQELPEIPFVVITDIRNDANGPGGNVSSWDTSKWLERVYLGYYEEQADGTRKWQDLDSNIANVSIERQLLGTADDSTPSFTPPAGPSDAAPDKTYEYLFSKPSIYLGEVQVYYHREQYAVDIRPVDRQNLQTLGYGRFVYTGVLDDGSNTVVVPAQTFLNSSNGYVNENAYALQTMYAGLIYQIEQTRSQSNYNYDKQKTIHDFRLMYDTASETHYISSETVDFDDKYRNYITEDEDTIYHILALNNWGGNEYEIEIQLVDAEDFDKLLNDGKFELYSKLNNAGTTTYQKDESFISNGDGTFTFRGRANAHYRLYQKETNKGYQIHDGYYVFDISSASSSYVINVKDTDHQVIWIEGINGWEGPANKNAGPIIISNQDKYGEMKVKVNAKGIWGYHGDALFTVELKGSDEEGRVRTFYRTVCVPGTVEFGNNGYKDNVQSEILIVEDIPKGEYQVTVYASLRTGNGLPQTKTGYVTRRGIGEVVEFDFENQNESLLSDTDTITNGYKIKFD